MLTVKNTAISITRGDSGYLTLSLTDNEGNAYTLTSGDKVNIQVRTAANTGELLFQGTITVTNGVPVWHIKPEDTSGADVRTYYWDAQLERSNGDIFTFIPSSTFTLLDEVTIAE